MYICVITNAITTRNWSFSTMAIREYDGIFLEVQGNSERGIHLLPFIIGNSFVLFSST